MRRQIIKTKPVRPYRVARLIIAVLVIIVIAAVVFELWTKAHATHALATHVAFVLQDSLMRAANPQSPVVQ